MDRARDGPPRPGHRSQLSSWNSALRVELVFVGPAASHVELSWAMPEFKALFERLATFCRVLQFQQLQR